MSSAVEAEMALAELSGGFQWKNGQTTWRGWVFAYSKRELLAFPTDAHVTLYRPDGSRANGRTVSGVTERELQYKTLMHGIASALNAQRS